MIRRVLWRAPDEPAVAFDRLDATTRMRVLFVSVALLTDALIYLALRGSSEVRPQVLHTFLWINVPLLMCDGVLAWIGLRRPRIGRVL